MSLGQTAGVDWIGWWTWLTSILTTAFGLGMVIFLHELGHFAAAKWCNVQVDRFAIGFMTPIISRTYGETEYALCWLPFGGYVAMLGQDDIDPSQMTDDEVALDPRSYSAKSVPARMLIISAGVIMNLITGTLFFVTAYGMGVEQATPYVGEVVVGSAAWERGLEVGDRIRSINGQKTNDFSDIIRGTALSLGELDLMVETRSGDSYRVKATPDETGRRRQLGVGSLIGLTAAGNRNMPATIAGLPAAEAGFEPGDKIVAVDGESVADSIDFRNALEAKREKSVAITVQREDNAKSASVDLTVPPHRARAFGFHVDAGPVNSVVDNSVGAEEGIQVGDRIAKIDGIGIGVELDPLDLPVYLAERAGKSVVVTINREEGGNLEEFDLTLEPSKSHPWMYPSKRRGSGLAISSLGVTMPLIPTIIQIDEGSAAAQAGLKVRDSLVQVEVAASGDEFDALGGQAFTFDVTTDGWPFVIDQLAMIPNGDLTLTVETAEEGKLSTVELRGVPLDRFVASTRGVRLYGDTQSRKAESIGEAFAMGARQTRTSALDIYLTLRSLVSGKISIKEMAGPLQIATMGYQVAKSGLADFLVFLGFLSINLAVINFLPIPVLDGGHMVFLIWEGITGKKPPRFIVEYATYIGLIFIVTLMLFVIGLDALKLVGLSN